jgi:hypothetical protein
LQTSVSFWHYGADIVSRSRTNQPPQKLRLHQRDVYGQKQVPLTPRNTERCVNSAKRPATDDSVFDNLGKLAEAVSTSDNHRWRLTSGGYVVERDLQ